MKKNVITITYGEENIEELIVKSMVNELLSFISNRKSN
jgi:hypothetical protein